jgi:outer membrane receptor protein involved in Fe transport
MEHRTRKVSASGAVLLALGLQSARAQDAAPPTAAPAAQPEEEITVTAKRLDAARIGIEPQVGASTYSFSAQAIENLPGGENAPLNEVLLHAPGVDQDALGDGALHVRNEHLEVQYRINGVLLPDGVSFFGQGLSPRFANSIQLITGVLPAEYGLRTAGIVDIETKSGIFQPGGSVGIYGGSYGTIQPSAEYGGSIDGYNYFVAGDYLQSDHGINAVTPNYDVVHDNTQQSHGFAYLDKIVDSASKITVMAGTFDGQFQIPNNPGQPPAFTVNGNANFDSNQLNEHQTETSQYGILSYLRAEQDFDFQISGYTKYSTLHFHPDIIGDIAFNGIAQDALRQSFANGIQGEASYRAGPDHTVRAGLNMTGERATSDTTNYTELAAGPDTPIIIGDNQAKTGWTYSLYVQDEWRITPTVTVNYGGRFDVVNAYTNENQISPRLNAVWKATDSTTVHAGYANYFTPPPLELIPNTDVALFAPTTGALPSSQSSPVKAERSHYFDTGVEQEVLPGFKVGLDAYYKYARNLLDEGQFSAPVVLTPFNYHVGYNKGVELTTSFDKGPFSYYGNLAIAEQKAEGISSAQALFTAADLAYISSHLVNTDHSQLMTASAGLSYLWEGTRYSVDVIAGSGLRKDDPGAPLNGTVPSYEQVNFGVSHKFDVAYGGPLTVRLDLINVLDEVYLLRSGAAVGEFAPQFGPRRSFFVSVRKDF